MKKYQQGDVVLIQVKNIEDDLEKIKTRTIQEGEMTGHSHVLQGECELFAPSKKTGKRYLRLVKPTKLLHEEHKPIELPEGDYEIRIVREVDHLNDLIRPVID